ncbi:hypothetical protein GCM10008904_26960 [Paraclostridium ghonii]|uniref:Uncharacterized protein n=1 Tax=Paraclostridium ghonii TaxID=29358 RepID=A0ABU0MXX1_9FIRM|nr:hypothetical protein [Paeniclostridium ghonii]MDQ0555751.1 hypothetical protein [Paeniclostridium ghonii]
MNKDLKLRRNIWFCLGVVLLIATIWSIFCNNNFGLFYLVLTVISSVGALRNHKELTGYTD